MNRTTIVAGLRFLFGALFAFAAGLVPVYFWVVALLESLIAPLIPALALPGVYGFLWALRRNKKLSRWYLLFPALPSLSVGLAGFVITVRRGVVPALIWPAIFFVSVALFLFGRAIARKAGMERH
ncbi:MAG: hypothetical protein GF344_18770 [Chitinivibrionales bacterium]|nr:hypothetical protein [Chitinivibrionales bacterium]